jgi:phosphate transport system permease protein
VPELPASPQYRTSWQFPLRLLKNRFARGAVATGGIGVIVAIPLIFFYLLYVVLPSLETPEMESVASYALQGGSSVLYLAMDGQAEVGDDIRPRWPGALLD